MVLPDGQQVYAVVHARRRESGLGDGGWWYRLTLPLWSATHLPGDRLLAEPFTVEWWAPAHVCTPLKGQDYDEVVTEPAQGTAARPRWVLEDVLNPSPDAPELVVHRGDCAAGQGPLRPATAEQVREAAASGRTARCSICSPPT
ncbi:hypothetical protein SAMN06297387_1284 [Streptomyces zhaozhouensis]|uniref:Uncharacterized protein n=1 Tax=Streptomyces zhaozhouensis TaxID=1300267 RepID=A0A286E7V3_9ACTN|nr:DUF6233 domain-containing protein [Streptomyces zhaozhouensis]SOD66934.1 hypothetical protein SAMN06297387_1284 [Streptomyces zhaozhouensis]